MKIFNMVKNHSENFRFHIRQRLLLQFFEATMNLALIALLSILITSTLWEGFCLAQLF